MKRAIEKAMEEFPIVGDLHLRNAYISGYHQAEKDLANAFQAKYAKELARADLALTWEDRDKGYEPSGINPIEIGGIELAASDLVQAVEGYVCPKKDDKYVFRNEVLAKCNQLKKLLDETL